VSFNKLTFILIPWAKSPWINLLFMDPRDSLSCLQVFAVGVYPRLDDSNLYPVPVTFGCILILSYPIQFRSYSCFPLVSLSDYNFYAVLTYIMCAVLRAKCSDHHIICDLVTKISTPRFQYQISSKSYEYYLRWDTWIDRIQFLNCMLYFVYRTHKNYSHVKNFVCNLNHPTMF
jgi:hypothetical protein